MITYTNEVLDSYDGQTNCEAGIYVDNNIMGYVQYVLFEGELTISDIFIRPDSRRMGYGSRLIKYVKKINPDYKYIPSMKTEDGSKFIHKDISMDECFNAKFVSESINFSRDESNPLRKINIGQSHIMKDKNGRSINIGDNVIVSEETIDNEFFGTVDSFSSDMVIVIDQEDEYYSVMPLELEIVDSNGESIKESISFNRDESDPLRKLGIGKSYEIWREQHSGKPILSIVCFLEDPSKNKKRYLVSLFYSKNPDGNDTIWFDRERLIGGWQLGGMGFSLSNLRNKPEKAFDAGFDESRSWIDDFHFNEEVINPLLSKDPIKVKKFMNDLSKEWFESDFESMMKDWFKTGTNRVKDIKYNIL